MASIDLYTKQQIDAKIPSTSGASSGDVLTFNGSANVWAAPGGGGSGISAHTYTTYGALITDILAHPSGLLAHDHSLNALSDLNFKLGTNAVDLHNSYIAKDGSTGLFISEDTTGDISDSSTATTATFNRTTVYATGSGNTINTNSTVVDISKLIFYY